MEYEVTFEGAIERGNSVRTFRFTRPDGFSYKAGHYFLLKLRDDLMKPFSFSSAPTESGYFECTTRMSGSDFKKALWALAPGSKVRILGPNGKFTLDDSRRMVVFLAGGMGITPFSSMCKGVVDSKTDCDIVLLWGVNTMEEAFFKADFDAMVREASNLKVVYVPLKAPPGWMGCSGLISREHLESQVPDYAQRVFYVCGPPRMVESMDRILGELGIRNEDIIKEQFS